MKFFLALISIIFFSSTSCNKTKINKINSNHNFFIPIKYVIDGKMVKLDDDFDFLIIENSDTIKIKHTNNILEIPEFFKKEDYKVLFRCKEDNIVFDKLSNKMLNPNQKTNWIIGVDNKPFDKLLGLMDVKEYDKSNYKKIEYLQFDPQEYGDGIQLVNKY
ncbi:hypothetical protein SAMN05444360_1051 [Chryseobacterium carnipullorum]|uniref:hypothetical protein n=1 Tax=Chryseobacterium carnipullorum TaxID=1124835 RepID=UPI00091D3EFB|nr:hypothetical protein [Chryseobacterium carnipullorum]SHL84108.1 hypothetical protein SAMN05444360_1051 [Chryseobacterium carnipullorum]